MAGVQAGDGMNRSQDCNLYHGDRVKWEFALFVTRRLLRQVTSEVTDTRRKFTETFARAGAWPRHLIRTVSRDRQ